MTILGKWRIRIRIGQSHRYRTADSDNWTGIYIYVASKHLNTNVSYPIFLVVSASSPSGDASNLASPSGTQHLTFQTCSTSPYRWMGGGPTTGLNPKLPKTVYQVKMRQVKYLPTYVGFGFNLIIFPLMVSESCCSPSNKPGDNVWSSPFP